MNTYRTATRSMMNLTCGHAAPMPRFTPAQLFAAKTAGEIPTANLMLTCPAGCGLVDVLPVSCNPRHADIRTIRRTDGTSYLSCRECGATRDN